MAKRKPAGIVDDIVGGIRDIVSPWLGNPPGEARQVTQGKALARTAAETLDQVYAGGMIKAGAQGNKALAKQAGINAAALGAGAAVGYGVSKAAGAVVKSGVPARIVNKLTNQQILVHGSPTQGLTVINPTRGVNRNKGTRGVDIGLQGFFGVPGKNPQFGPNVAKNYALGDQELNIQQNVIGQGSVYIAKVNRSNLIFEQSGQVARTSVPSPVVSEIRLNSISRDKAQSFLDQYVSELKAAGGPTVPRKIRKQLKNFR